MQIVVKLLDTIRGTMRCWDAIKLRGGGGKNSKNGWVTNNEGWLLINGGRGLTALQTMYYVNARVYPHLCYVIVSWKENYSSFIVLPFPVYLISKIPRMFNFSLIIFLITCCVLPHYYIVCMFHVAIFVVAFQDLDCQDFNVLSGWSWTHHIYIVMNGPFTLLQEM